jgi:hypothetical protein
VSTNLAQLRSGGAERPTRTTQSGSGS